MCKLFAYINHETRDIPAYMGTKINRALKQLFYINSYGQVDGSGIMWMNKGGVTGSLKSPIPSPMFMEMKAFDNIKDGLYRNKFVAGHTRYSTVGSNTWENSHPFEYGEYMGIQNGTISNSHKSLVLGRISPCNVDTASVFWAFEQQGIDSTLDRYEGEGVFMFFNKELKTFNVVKNYYRTLHKAKLKDLDVYLMATDKFALEFVAERNGLVFDSVVPVEDDMLIEYTSDNTVISTVRDVPGPVVKSYYGNYGSGKGGYNYSNYKSKQHSSPTGNKAITKQNSTFGGQKTVGTKTVAAAKQEKTLPVEKAKPDPVKSTRSDISYYITDCDICLNPIDSNSMIFSDDPDPLKSTYVACSCCGKELGEFIGKPTYKIEDITGLAT